MKASLITIDNGWIYVRHTPIVDFQPTILFVHGLGDSSLSFIEAFRSSNLKSFNVVAPDLVGHGGSSDAPNENYSFETQIKCLYRVVDALGISEFFLVGHSLGGDLATHLVANDQGRVQGLVNVEGNLTPPDVVSSKQAVMAAERGLFDTWFKETFMTDTVLNQWGAKWASCRRYYASLWFCRPHAFLSCASEVCRQNSALSNKSASKTGLLFQQINVPKVYCWGGGMSEETTKLIKEKGISTWGFADASHWPMIDKEEEFYRLLSNFCNKTH